ncbi:hypothetical protein D3C72_2356730 [compost metagenome]
MKRRISVTVPVFLQPNFVAIGLNVWMWIVKSAYTFHFTKHVIKRPVLLHQENNVFGIVKCSARLGVNGHGF